MLHEPNQAIGIIGQQQAVRVQRDHVGGTGDEPALFDLSRFFERESTGFLNDAHPFPQETQVAVQVHRFVRFMREIPIPFPFKDFDLNLETAVQDGIGKLDLIRQSLAVAFDGELSPP